MPENINRDIQSQSQYQGKSRQQRGNESKQTDDVHGHDVHHGAELREDVIYRIVEKVFNDKLDMIKIMVECCVNKRMRDIRKRMFVRPTSLQSELDTVTQSSLASFGTENYTYLLMPHLTNLIKSSHDFHVILQKIIVDLYFNPNHKQNNIIYIPPNTYKCITMYVDNAWRNLDMESALESIMRRANDVLQHYLVGVSEDEATTFRSIIGKKKYDMLQNWTNTIDNMEDYEDFRQGLLKETEHTIVTNQHLVHPNIMEIPSNMSSSIGI